MVLPRGKLTPNDLRWPQIPTLTWGDHNFFRSKYCRTIQRTSQWYFMQKDGFQKKEIEERKVENWKEFSIASDMILRKWLPRNVLYINTGGSTLNYQKYMRFQFDACLLKLSANQTQASFIIQSGRALQTNSSSRNIKIIKVISIDGFGRVVEVSIIVNFGRSNNKIWSENKNW